MTIYRCKLSERMYTSWTFWSKPISTTLGKQKQRQENHWKFGVSMVNTWSSRLARSIVLSNIYIKTCSTLGCSAVSSPIQEWACHYIWSQTKLSSNSDSAASSYRPLGFGGSIGTPKSQFSLVQYLSVNVIWFTTLDMTVYVSHWQQVVSPGDFLSPVSSLYSLSTKVSPKQCPLVLVCCRDFSDLHYLPCPPHEVLYVTTISAFPECRSLSLVTPCRNHFSLASWS